MKSAASPPGFFLLAVLIALLMASPGSAAVLRVRASTVCAGSCTGYWTSTYSQISDALAAASLGDEIWVAEGTYGPIVLKDGVSIFGGFRGNETSRNAARPDWYRTIISGNSEFRTVTAVGISAQTTLRGLQIREGWTCCDFPGEPGGGILVQDSDLRVVDCDFESNDTRYFGGAVAVVGNSAPHFSNCRFRFNGRTLAWSGGAVAVFDGAPMFVNCEFYGNAAQEGGAIANLWGATTLVNCTFVGNRATKARGGALYDFEGRATVVNSILWQNDAETPGSGQIYNAKGFQTSVSHSDVEGGFPGTGNINSDPRFVDMKQPLSDWLFIEHDPEEIDLSLNPTSPCLDSGDASEVPADVVDLDGDGNVVEASPWDLRRSRRSVDHPAAVNQGGTPPVDMGAYESTPPIFVRASVAPGGNGTSWATAFQRVQDALTAAQQVGTEQVREIWIAEGTYRPDTGTNRNGVFQLANRLFLYGGFVGNESERTPDPAAHPTVLSGDLGGNDANEIFSDNSHHLVAACALDRPSGLFGLTLRGANATDAVTRPCGTTGTATNGGGVHVVNSHELVIRDCTIEDCQAANGGGISVDTSSARVIDSTVLSNSGTSAGGGLFATSSRISVEGCTVDRNTASFGGGARFQLCLASLDSSVVSRNMATGSTGGGAVLISGNELAIVNCTVAENVASLSIGGGVRSGSNAQTPVVIQNTVLWNNRGSANPPPALGDQQLSGLNTSQFTVSHSNVEGGWTGSGTNNLGANPVADDPQFVCLGDSHADYRLRLDSPCIDAGLYGASSRFLDVQGAPRNQGSNWITDMGAYEVRDCPDVPAPGAEPSGVKKNRYLSFVPPATPNQSIALRVRFVSLQPHAQGFPDHECETQWVGEPMQYTNSAGFLPPFHASPLQCTPRFQDFSAIPVLHVYGAAVVPGSVYEVEAVRADCAENPASARFSAPLTILTAKWGDVATPFYPDNPTQPDFADISAMSATFQGIAGALPKPRAQLQPNALNPNTPVSFADVSMCVGAFNGTPYPASYSGPVSCAPPGL